jgi:hypothetical protein
MSRELKISVIKTVVENWGTIVPSNIHECGVIVSKNESKNEHRIIDCFWLNDVMINKYENGFIVDYEHIPYDNLSDEVIDDCYDFVIQYEELMTYVF